MWTKLNPLSFSTNLDKGADPETFSPMSGLIHVVTALMYCSELIFHFNEAMRETNKQKKSRHELL